MSLEALTDAIKARIARTNSALNATVKFALGNDGVIYVDGKSQPTSVTNENKPADCTIKVSLDDLEQMIAGRLNSNAAFITGRLRVEGDMAVAISLGKLMG